MFTTLAFIFALFFATPAQTSTAPALDIATVANVESITPCIHEDGSGGELPCYWDGATMGNGEGLSYTINADGSTTYDTEDAAITNCVNEDGSGGSLPCYWDGAERGNGVGLEYVIMADGSTVYLSESMVTAENTEEAYAWAAFDVAHAETLLPADVETKVSYAGLYDGHALTSTEIAVWDSNGTAYLFNF